MNVPAIDQAGAILQAAKTYNVPTWVLVGVYGKETSFGSNVTTSSAGAVGPFQFIPSTAAQYGYPQTNDPSIPQFEQQANSAAKYLSQLYASSHSWDTALRSYSGGGYGQADVQAAANQVPSSLKTQLDKGLLNTGGFSVPILSPIGTGIVNVVGGPVKAAVTAAQVAAKVADALFSGSFWVKALEFVGGSILIFMGIRWLAESGSSSNPSTKTRHVPVPV